MSNTKLEVPLNNSLRRNTHLTTVMPKLIRKIALFSKIQHYTLKKCLLKNIYYSFFNLHQTCASLIWRQPKYEKFFL